MIIIMSKYDINPDILMKVFGTITLILIRFSINFKTISEKFIAQNI